MANESPTESDKTAMAAVVGQLKKNGDLRRSFAKPEDTLDLVLTHGEKVSSVKDVILEHDKGANTAIVHVVTKDNHRFQAVVDKVGKFEAVAVEYVTPIPFAPHLPVHKKHSAPDRK